MKVSRKSKKHGKERRRIWRKLHLSVDAKTHEFICADLLLTNVTDSEAFPGLIRQIHRKISALISPRKGAGYWLGEYAYRNRAVAYQRLSGSNAQWKWITDYNDR